MPKPVQKLKKTTSRSTWKLFERNTARLFGAERTPLSGGLKHFMTNSDSLHPRLYIECKLRQRFEVWKLFDQTIERATLENKIPLVALKQKGAEGSLLVLRPEDLVKIAKEFKDGNKSRQPRKSKKSQ